MILKRLEKNGKIKAMYSSSTIGGSIYDKETKELIVIFNNGGRYKYHNVEPTDYMRLETAESNGTSFTKYIKNKYQNFEKLEKLSESAINTMTKEISELKPLEETPNVEAEKDNTEVNTYLAPDLTNQWVKITEMYNEGIITTFEFKTLALAFDLLKKNGVIS